MLPADQPAPSVSDFRVGGGGAGTAGTGGTGGMGDTKRGTKKEKKEKPPSKIAEGKAKDANVKLGDIKNLISKIEASESLPLGLKVFFLYFF